jgi:hypothetical protein
MTDVDEQFRDRVMGMLLVILIISTLALVTSGAAWYRTEHRNCWYEQQSSNGQVSVVPHCN